MPIKKECKNCELKEYIVVTITDDGKCRECGKELLPNFNLAQQPVESEEWEKEFEKQFPKIMGKNKVKNFPSEAYYDIKQFIKSLLLSKEEEWKREQEILINTIIATLKK